ncbi:MAG: hypothetical protein L3J58_11810 [Emcibacter sp.]|nr:hypothetical protein [Emcibacter sp.]
MVDEIEADLSASDTFSDWLSLRGVGEHNFAVEATGSFVGTLTAQVRSVNGNIVDLEDFTAIFTRQGTLNGSFDFRIGFKAGNYTSGTANIRIRR